MSTIDSENISKPTPDAAQKTPLTLPLMDRLSTRGRFDLAVRMYQDTGLSAEGHRHYPLRPVKALRRSPATLLPLCPFLDDWGAVAAKLEENHEATFAKSNNNFARNWL